jgi:MoaA/NifB/PqqE/SkfB family radical SAM enzyme
MASKTFCVNPYLNLSIHPKGVVKPCCMSTKEFITDDGHTTLADASIIKFWNSKDRKLMISNLNNGVQISECDFCWHEERAGKESKRIRDNKTYQDRNLTDDMYPVVVDLSLGNLCNLKCRICSPVHSTPWMQEEAQIFYPDKKQIYFNQDRWKTVKHSFDETNNYLWEDLLGLLSKAERLDFAGGEPFYIDKHWEVLKACVENGWSNNQHIHYNTNATIFPEKHLHLLESFKTVDIQFSSDGVGSKFEYLRHPANFQKSEEIIDKFKEVRNNSNTEWLLGMCISVSAFNVYYFFETFEHYASKGIGMYINVVHDHHGTRILPTDLKEQIIDKLHSHSSEYNQNQWTKEREMICNHLKNSTPDDYAWNEFWKELVMRDKIRNEEYQNIFPEYYNLIKEYNYVE